MDASCARPAPIRRGKPGGGALEQRGPSRDRGGSRVNRPGLMRALTRGARGRRREGQEHMSSLDTDGCSDMFNRPEKAENTRVFGPSARRWMRPRRCRTGMQQTLRADPNGIWTASDRLFSQVQPPLPGAPGRLDRGFARIGVGPAMGWSRPVSRLVRPVDRLRSSRFGRAPLRIFPRIEARSGDGMGLALRTTQRVPRFGVEPQNAEGARR